MSGVKPLFSDVGKTTRARDVVRMSDRESHALQGVNIATRTHSYSEAMLQVTFAEIASVLDSVGSAVSTPEGHGCLCGALCLSAEYPFERWLEELVPDQPQSAWEGDASGALQLLYADTARGLRGTEMEFEPLLPDDDVALERRAEALSQWCQGFLYGFGTGRRIDAEALPTNVDEVLRDLTYISRATVDGPAEGDEEDEESYTEVVEYVRVGVQLIHDEFAVLRDAQLAPPLS
jgi:uncharacterized protein YgfB (UPF0149 family)